jgi:hypothetical protein
MLWAIKVSFRFPGGGNLDLLYDSTARPTRSEAWDAFIATLARIDDTPRTGAVTRDRMIAHARRKYRARCVRVWVTEIPPAA